MAARNEHPCKICGSSIPDKYEFCSKCKNKDRLRVIKKIKRSARKLKRKSVNQGYNKQSWRELRYKAFQLHGNACQCCGQKPPTVILHVDHITPVSWNSDRFFDLDNLQILCEDCNLGKMASDNTDFRQNVVPS